MKSFLLVFMGYIDLDTADIPVAVIRAKNASTGLKKAKNAMEKNLIVGYFFEEIRDDKFEWNQEPCISARITGEKVGFQNEGKQTFSLQEIQEIS